MKPRKPKTIKPYILQCRVDEEGYNAIKARMKEEGCPSFTCYFRYRLRHTHDLRYNSKKKPIRDKELNNILNLLLDRFVKIGTKYNQIVRTMNIEARHVYNGLTPYMNTRIFEDYLFKLMGYTENLRNSMAKCYEAVLRYYRENPETE